MNRRAAIRSMGAMRMVHPLRRNVRLDASASGGNSHNPPRLIWAQRPLLARHKDPIIHFSAPRQRHEKFPNRSRIERVFLPFPSTAIWPPSEVGGTSCHLRPHSSRTLIPEAYCNVSSARSRGSASRINILWTSASGRMRSASRSRTTGSLSARPTSYGREPMRWPKRATVVPTATLTPCGYDCDRKGAGRNPGGPRCLLASYCINAWRAIRGGVIHRKRNVPREKATEFLKGATCLERKMLYLIPTTIESGPPRCST